MRIVNRSLYSRTWENKHATCRLCGEATDTLSHLKCCRVIRNLFGVIDEDPAPQTIYLGLTPDYTPLTGSDALVWVLLWKFVLIAYTRVDTDHIPFDQKQVLTSTVRRLAQKLEAHRYRLVTAIDDHRARGERAPPSLVERFSRAVRPAAHFDVKGNIYLEAKSLRTLQMCGCYLRHPKWLTFSEEASPRSATHFAHDYPAVATPLRWEATIASERLRVALEAEVKRNEKSRDESRLLAQKVALRRRKSSML